MTPHRRRSESCGYVIAKLMYFPETRRARDGFAPLVRFNAPQALLSDSILDIKFRRPSRSCPWYQSAQPFSSQPMPEPRNRKIYAYHTALSCVLYTAFRAKPRFIDRLTIFIRYQNLNDIKILNCFFIFLQKEQISFIIFLGISKLSFASY